MTAEETLKACCENGEAWVVGNNWVEGKATNIYDAMTKFAKQESIEFAKWLDKEMASRIGENRWSVFEGYRTSDELYELFQKSKLQQ
jgi:hypothetical protein